MNLTCHHDSLLATKQLSGKCRGCWAGRAALVQQTHAQEKRRHHSEQCWKKGTRLDSNYATPLKPKMPQSASVTRHICWHIAVDHVLLVCMRWACVRHKMLNCCSSNASEQMKSNLTQNNHYFFGQLDINLDWCSCFKTRTKDWDLISARPKQSKLAS